MRKAFLVCVIVLACACAKSSAPLEVTNQKAQVRTVVSRKVITGAEARPAARVFKDPTTGKVRAPDADEVRALELATPPQPPSHPVTQTTYSDGSTSIELNEDYLNEVVVERAPDGTLKTHCATHNDQAPALETK